MTPKEHFVDIYKSKIHREGADELLKWLEERSDFFTAPASTRFHLACDEGLCIHSLHVYERLVSLMKNEEFRAVCFGDMPENEVEETIAVVSLLHDVCKTNFYAVEMRNKKNEHGVWQSVPFYTVKDTLPYGHGEKSVYIINGFMRLKRAEAMAIRWHMGAFADKDQLNTMTTAYDMYPLAMMLHTADMFASHIDEVEFE